MHFRESDGGPVVSILAFMQFLSVTGTHRSMSAARGVSGRHEVVAADLFLFASFFLSRRTTFDDLVHSHSQSLFPCDSDQSSITM